MGFAVLANLANIDASQAVPIALTAGQALPNTEYAIGMIPAPGFTLDLDLQTLELPSARGPGRIAGTISGLLVDELTVLPPLPGEVPPDEERRKIWVFMNELSLNFDLPLHDDACL